MAPMVPVMTQPAAVRQLAVSSGAVAGVPCAAEGSGTTVEIEVNAGVNVYPKPVDAPPSITSVTTTKVSVPMPAAGATGKTVGFGGVQPRKQDVCSLSMRLSLVPFGP